MQRPSNLLFALGAILVSLGASPLAAQVPGVSREQMWPAPTAEDWAMPCLVHFQRSLEDAVAVSRVTHRPILVCVNMDGEIASEHYAGIRYRQPEIAALYEPYVCLIASVYRHTPRDYGQNGERILCPRFGSVTCGEHIALEPQLFGEFFEGQRVAPRHIMIELDRSETYDVFYAFDTDSVFERIETGITERKVEIVPIARGDRTLLERVASPEQGDREFVERAFREGDPATRRAILESTAALGADASVDVLRLAIFGLDLELAGIARGALPAVQGEKGAALIAEALRVPLQPGEREALVAALERIDDVPWAATLAAAQRGLSARSDAIDPEAWARAMAALEVPAREKRALEVRLDEALRTVAERPEDPAVHLEAAEGFLTLAVDPDLAPSEAALAREDAARQRARAVELGATGWRVDGLDALLDYYGGDVEAAYSKAAQAVRAMPPGDYGWSAMAVLSLFAEARREAIRRAVRDKEEWPKEWFADVHAAYSALAHHPLATESEFTSHYDFLRRVGATAAAGTTLRAGLERFPDAWELHARLRGRVLWERGVDGLESVYDEMLRAPERSPNLEWFAGYAALVAAEFRRRRNDPVGAGESYDRALLHYERGVEANPETRASTDHYVAMALAGRARLALEARDLERAAAEIQAAFERSPDSAGDLDGIGISAVATAQMLLARLQESGRDALAAELRRALSELPPEALLPPAFEAQGPSGTSRPGRPRAGR